MSTKDNDMALPEGQTCAGCFHIRFCRAFVGRKGHETECDWSPSRFAWPDPRTSGVPLPPQPEKGAGGS